MITCVIWWYYKKQKANIEERDTNISSKVSSRNSTKNSTPKKESCCAHNVSVSSDSSGWSSIGKQVCQIIENTRLEYSKNQIRLDWKYDTRDITCPSIMTLKRDKNVLSYNPSEFEPMTHSITEWTVHTKRYYFTGTVVVPAGNFKVLLRIIHKDAVIAIMDSLKTAHQLRNGWYNQDMVKMQKESWLIPHKEALDKFIFATTFYRELIIFQLYSNTNHLEIKSFEVDLFAELQQRFEDDLMEIVTLDRLRAQTCRCMIGDYTYTAQKVAVNMKKQMETLGFSIYLNFLPEPFCGECFNENKYKSPFMAMLEKGDWPDNQSISEIM